MEKTVAQCAEVAKSIRKESETLAMICQRSQVLTLMHAMVSSTLLTKSCFLQALYLVIPRRDVAVLVSRPSFFSVVFKQHTMNSPTYHSLRSTKILSAEIACSLDDFSTLCTAVTAAGLSDALNGGKWTVFAPTNAAFAELGDTLDAVLSDPDLLTDILLFHAVGEKALKAKDLRCKKTTEMANGKDSRTVCRRGDIYQKGAGNPRSDMPKIVDTDIDACNGVIHVVDEVLLP